MTNPDYSTTVIHGEYYPHIDGIRALAVLPVVVFHVMAALCPGGFAGVDVFFVISGYLITSGILRDLDKGRFTLGSFYHRRIRRIMPAYFVLVSVVFAVGCAIYYASPLIYLGDTVIMGMLFSANLYFFFFSGGYFDTNIHGNPLLHLWSLSVEEQFYLFMPLLCAVIWRLRRGWLAPALAMIAAMSFAGAVYAVATGRQSSAFYLLHFRAWELLAGSLLSMLPRRTQADAASGSTARLSGMSPARPASLATIGLLMVLLPYALLSSATPFPGVAAVSPVIGAALLIRYGQSGWVARVLAWRPFVAIGKISYSLYLWHWPVTVFWKYTVYDQVSWYDYAGMFLVSFLLAYASWRFIEMPVRTSQAWSMRRSFAFAGVGSLLLISIGAACTYNDGWSGILHPEANAMSSNEFPSRVGRLLIGFNTRVRSMLGYATNDPFRMLSGLDGDFKLGVAEQPPEVLVVGDSHAGHLQYGVHALLGESSRAGYAISRSSTTMFDVEAAAGRHVLEALAARPDVSKVVLASRWLLQSSAAKNPPTDPGKWKVQLEEFASRVKSMDKELFIATDIPNYAYSPGDIAARMKIIAPRTLEPGWGAFDQSESEYGRMQGDLNRELEAICRRTGATLIPLHTALRQGDRYVVFDAAGATTVPLYKDEHHLSRFGSTRAARLIVSHIFPEGDAASRSMP